MALEGHRPDVETGALGVETGQVAQRRRGRPGRRDRRSGVLGQVEMAGPWSVRSPRAAKDVRLRLDVLEDRPTTRVYQQELARTEAASPDHLIGLERHRPGLGRGRDQPIGGHREGHRAQPVPIDERADSPTVAEDDRGRPVPRRDEPGHPAPERSHEGVPGHAQRRRLRDEREQRGIEAPAGQDEQLERLVERERVGAVRGEKRAGLAQTCRDRSGRSARSAARPRTCSRFPRTVLISPLWASERKGWASRQSGAVFVA